MTGYNFNRHKQVEGHRPSRTLTTNNISETRKHRQSNRHVYQRRVHLIPRDLDL